MHKVNILNTDLILDDTAFNFFRIALDLCPNPIIVDYNKDNLSGCCVVWDGESVKDLSSSRS